jgi:hypothetical protein
LVLFNILFPHLPRKTEEPSIRIIEVQNGYFQNAVYSVAATRISSVAKEYTF